MNIFYLDRTPHKAAQAHCDKHCVKMILESAQMLSTAQRTNQPQLSADADSVLYKVAHLNHPSSIWTRTSEDHYFWLYCLFLSLQAEYKRRYNKIHKSAALNELLMKLPPCPESGFIDPPQCMPDQYKQDDCVEAYRAYYIGEKAKFAVWKYTPTPKWFYAGSSN